MSLLPPQITLQLTVLICALLFIFFGMPPLMCLAAIPVVLLFIFLSVYGAYFNKSVDLCNVSNQMLTHGCQELILHSLPGSATDVLGC